MCVLDPTATFPPQGGGGKGKKEGRSSTGARQQLGAPAKLRACIKSSPGLRPAARPRTEAIIAEAKCD